MDTYWRLDMFCVTMLIVFESCCHAKASMIQQAVDFREEDRMVGSLVIKYGAAVFQSHSSWGIATEFHFGDILQDITDTMSESKKLGQKFETWALDPTFLGHIEQTDSYTKYAGYSTAGNHSTPKTLDKHIDATRQNAYETYQNVRYNTQVLDALLLSLRSECVMYNRSLSTRIRRGWFDGIGSMLKTLTGVGDRDEMNGIKENIERIKSNEAHLTHFMTHSASLLNVTAIESSENRAKLNYLIMIMRQNSASLGRAQQLLQVETNATVMLSFIMSLTTYHTTLMERVQHLEIVVQRRIQILGDALGGRINLHWINPKALQNVLKKVSVVLPTIGKFLKFPIDVNNGYHIVKIYETLSASVVKLQGKTFITFAVPLVDERTVMDIYEIIPLPIPHNRSTLGDIVIKPDMKYLAITKDRLNYVPLTKTEYLNCLARSDLGYCTNESPVFRASANPNSCTLDAILKNEVGNCEVYLTRPNNDMIKIRAFGKNRWSIISKTDITISVTCTNSAKILFMTSPIDYLQLAPGCSAISNSFMIFAKQVGRTIVDREIEFEPMAKFNDLYSAISNRPSSINLDITDDILKELNPSSISLSELDSLVADSLQAGTAWSVFQYKIAPPSSIIGYILILLLVIGVAIFIRNKYRTRNRHIRPTNEAVSLVSREEITGEEPKASAPVVNYPILY